jgi:uncharacterized protein
VSDETVGQGKPDLQALDEYLMSDESPENCMGLSDLDGFLTAIVIGPDLIKPSEWLPVVWGGESPEFSDDAQATTILGAVLGRYNEIAQSLAKIPPEIDPILWEANGGVVIAGDWAEGFLDAMDLRSREWMEMLDDEEEGVPLLPILALAGDENEGIALAGGVEELENLRSKASVLIPTYVVKIDAYWKLRRRPSVPTELRARKPGRNDPCPCGSGRKYERCCGAN